MKRIAKLFVAVLALVVMGFALYVRLAPSDPVVWNVDPLTVAKPSTANSFLLRPVDSDASGEVYQTTPRGLLAAFDAVARAAPRTTVLAGSVEEGQITYLTRSVWWGFPDFTSVRAVPDRDGARLAIFARARFGEYDFGANRARTLNWMSKLDLDDLPADS